MSSVREEDRTTAQLGFPEATNMERVGVQDNRPARPRTRQLFIRGEARERDPIFTVLGEVSWLNTITHRKTTATSFPHGPHGHATEH